MDKNEERKILGKILKICKNTKIPEELIKEENHYIYAHPDFFIKTDEFDIRLGIRCPKNDYIDYFIDCKSRKDDEEFHWRYINFEDSRANHNQLVEDCFDAYRNRLDKILKKRYPHAYESGPIFDSYSPMLGDH